jgi:hypothetical protein
VIVPLRLAEPGFAWTVYAMGPDVVPEVVPGTIHRADVDTVQPQKPDPDVVAVTLKLPPATGTFWVVGNNVYGHRDSPSWFTVSVAEPPIQWTVIVPLRLVELGFACTV